MSYADLIAAVRSLPRRDKLRLLQHLAGEVADEVDVQAEAGIRPGADYPVWSPHAATDAARALQDALEAERGTRTRGGE